MKRTQLVQKTKLIARRVLAVSLFRVILLVVLETATALVLSLVFSALAERIAPNAIVKVGPIAIHVVSVLATLVATLFLLPLSLGVVEYLLGLVRRTNPRVSDVFLWFSDSEKLKHVGRYFLYVAALSLVTIPLATIPAQYLMDTANTLMTDLSTRVQLDPTQLTFNWNLVDWVAVAACVVAMFVGALIKVRLFMTPHIFVDRCKTHSAFAAAAASWKLTKGYLWTYVWMMLSFIGWYLLAALTGFLILFYVLPYVQLATIILSEFIRAEHAFQNRPPQDETPSDEVQV